MIYLTLFISFLKIGAFSFGGGMGMLALIQQEVLAHGWADEELLFNFVAVAESTPGPIAVNIATFIGCEQAGFLGGLCATVGVVLPAFIIILIIAALFKSFAKNKYVKMLLNGLKPVIIGLIFATGLSLLLNNIIYNYGNFELQQSINVMSLMIICFLIYSIYYYKKFFKVEISPIALIIISAGLGIIAFY